MKKEQLEQVWQREWSAAFSGWDFSRLDGRWADEPLPWDYEAIAKSLLKPTDRLLDMETGGGEVLLSLGHPGHLCAVTEGWAPNVALCREKLTPLGVRVEACKPEQEPLPFAAGSFDLVLNRHGDYGLSEVWRVLRPGGRFLTQQVGGENNRALSQALIEGFTPLVPDHNLAHCKGELEAAGFRVERGEECFPALEFYDVGAVCYFAKIIEWEFPDFRVETALPRLWALQETLEREGKVTSREHRFLVQGVKE